MADGALVAEMSNTVRSGTGSRLTNGSDIISTVVLFYLGYW